MYIYIYIYKYIYILHMYIKCIYIIRIYIMSIQAYFYLFFKNLLIFFVADVSDALQQQLLFQTMPIP